MKNKKLIVLAKFYKGELNPFDGAALECALEMGFTDITLLTMSPPSALECVKGITRLGVKAVMLSDTAYAGSDTIATSLVLAKAIERLSPDLIFCGRQSVDGDTAQVPPMLAQRLGFDLITRVLNVDGENLVLRNGEIVKPNVKSIITFERCRTLRFPSIFSKTKDVEVLDNKTLCVPENLCGLLGSPTKVVKAYESSVGRRTCKFVTMPELDGLIKQGLKREREKIVRSQGEKLDRVCYIGNVKDVAEQIAKEAIPLSVKGFTEKAFANKLKEINPKAVLWEDEEKIKNFASKVAVIAGAGACADCVSFSVSGGQLVMTRPAQGGNVTADIVCENNMAFATVRTARQDCADVIFSIGNGGVSQLENVKKLAKKYDADTACSRIVADSGKMEYPAQVGLTGKTVSPKVYVAFGISGAVQHTSAISGAGTIIAINKDKDARIFDYADYGIIDCVENIKILGE